MNKNPDKWKLSSKARVIPKEQRRQYPPEAFEDRNTKVKISMYVDLDVLNYFKARAGGMPYQTMINAELRRIMQTEQQQTDLMAAAEQAATMLGSAIREAKRQAKEKEKMKV
jgi:uncharacterized protein (DUF4415 family)